MMVPQLLLVLLQLSSAGEVSLLRNNPYHDDTAAFHVAARALLGSAAHKVTVAKRRLQSLEDGIDGMGVFSSATAVISDGLQDTISTMLGALKPNKASDLFGTTSSDIVTSLTKSATSGTSSTELGSVLEQLNAVRESNLNLYSGLEDTLSAWKAVPLLVNSSTTTNSGPTNSSNVFQTARGSGLLGIKGIMDTLIESGDVSGLSQLDVASLTTSNDTAVVGYSPLFGGGEIVGRLLSLTPFIPSDDALVSAAPAAQEQVAAALDQSLQLQGIIGQLFSLFSGAAMFPLRIAVDGLQSAVNIINRAPRALSSYSGLGRALNSLLLDVRGVAYGFDMTSEQSGILGAITDAITNALDCLGQLTSETLNQGFFKTLYKYLEQIGNNLVRLDGGEFYSKLRNSGLNMNLTIGNRGGFFSPTQFRSTFPLITGGFGLAIQAFGTAADVIGTVSLNFVGYGMKFFAALMRPFLRIAGTTLDVFRTFLYTIFIRTPAMFLDALGVTSLIRAISNSFNQAINGRFGGMSVDDSSLSKLSTNELLSTDYLESLIHGSSTSAVSADDAVTALLKQMGLQSASDLSEELSDSLSQQSAGITDLFTLPLNVMSDFMSAGMSTVIGTVASVIRSSRSASENLLNNGSAGVISLLSGGVLSRTPDWSTSGSEAYLNSILWPFRGTFSSLFDVNGRRLLEDDDASPLVSATLANAISTADALENNGTAAAGAAASTAAATAAATAATSISEEDVAGTALIAAAGGVFSVMEAVYNVAQTAAQIPCETESEKAIKEVLNTAAIAGNPARLLAAMGVSDDNAVAVLSMAANATDIAATPAVDVDTAANATTADSDDICKAKIAALKALAAWSESQGAMLAKIIEVGNSTSSEVINEMSGLIADATCSTGLPKVV